MKMYLYTFAYDQIEKEGYKSLSMFDKNTQSVKSALWTHRHSAKSEDDEKILAYLENTFKGRLRSICAITEPAPAAEYKHPYLNHLVHHADVISFDLSQLIKDGIVEEIYCKDLRETVLLDSAFENIYKIKSIEEIDTSPLDWNLCGSDAYLKYSPWATIKHYFLVLKDGFIPVKYLSREP